MLASAMYLTQAGKITLLNSLPTSLTILFLCTFKMHATVIKQKDKYWKYGIWRGSGIDNRKPPKAVCQLVQWFAIKKKEVWGVLNLTTQYEAVLLKNLHKFFNRADLP